MYSLCSGMWKEWNKAVEYGVLLTGLDGAGKTTLLEQIKDRSGIPRGAPIDRVAPTVGLNIAKVKHHGVQMKVWDLGGESSIRVIWERYAGCADALVFVICAQAASRWEEAAREISKLLQRPDCFKTPLLVIANRCTDPELLSLIENAIQCPQLSQRKYTLQPADLLTGEGVDHLLRWLTAVLAESPKPKAEISS